MRVLIVDDEPLARRRLHALIAADGRGTVVGECDSVDSAVRFLTGPASVDVVLLDVEMPDGSGFDVITRVCTAVMPSVVFVTAYDAHAVRAFEVHAMDYLLKPFDRARFADAMDRVARHLAARHTPEGGGDARLAQLLSEAGRGMPLAGRLALKEEDRITFVPTPQIDWLQADGKHTVLHAKGAGRPVRETLAEIAGRLPTPPFVRIHRSLVVNLDGVTEIQRWFHGDFVFVMRDGARLVSGRSFRDPLRELIEGRLLGRA